MRSRCRNPKNTDFHNYGGRGITISPRWDDFAAFYADMGDRPPDLTLERIDVNGNYEPANCRWATWIDQANNKRSSRRIEIDGEVRTLQQWSREFGIDHSKARYRLNQGFPMEAVFSTEDFRQ